jgi:hypothetical protein
MARQGPHQLAQKSTRTGRLPRPTCRSNAAWSTSTGCPWKSGIPHFPQIGAAPIFAAGTRLMLAQTGQATSGTSDMRFSPVERQYRLIVYPHDVTV